MPIAALWLAKVTMTPGVKTSEHKVLWVVLYLGIGLFSVFVFFIFWGYSAGDIEWEAGMSHLRETVEMFAYAVGVGITYILSRTGIKITDILAGRKSLKDIVREAMEKKAADRAAEPGDA